MREEGIRITDEIKFLKTSKTVLTAKKQKLVVVHKN
jgi:hypothetical protein